MSKRLDLTGQRFGRLVALKRLSNYHRDRTYYKCRCDCGKEKAIATHHLTGRAIVSCGCFSRSQAGKRRRINLISKRFGKLLVLGFSHIDNRGNTCWKCQCDCGNMKIICGRDMRSRNTKSCGCSKWEHKNVPRGRAAFNKLYGRYKAQAKSRGFSFRLSIKYFQEITKQNCHYCRIEPLSKTKGNNGNYIYNGIDRIDNMRGYTKGNVAPCCKQCNAMKGTMPQTEFLAHVERIHKHQHNSK